MIDFLAGLRVNQRLTTLLGYTIVGAMMACFMVSVVQLGRVLSPGWEGNYLVVLGVLFALEAFIVYRMRKDYSFMEPGWFVFYITEWVVLLVVTKFFQLSAHGASYFWTELHAWRVNFWVSFFNSEFQFTLLIVIIVWVVSLMIAQPLDVLRVDEKQLKVEEEVGMSQERAAARRQIIDIVLFLGVVMVLMTSLLRNDITAGWFNIPAMRLGVVNVVVYFALGLVLLSLTQFTVLHMRWSVNRVLINPGLATRWVQYSLIFLILLAGVALLLPTGYTRSLLLVLNWLMQAILTLGLYIYWLITLPFLFIGALLALLAGEPVQLKFEPFEQVTPLKPNPIVGLDFLELIRIVLFTVLVLGLVLYSFYYFIKLRRSQLAAIPRLRPLGWLISLWIWIVAWMGGVGRMVVLAVREGVQKLVYPASHRQEESAWQYLKLRGLTPRQRVLFYYLALVRRGAESGKARRPSQTPYEYAISLSAAMDKEVQNTGPQPTPGVDIQAITENFVQAQYSRHEISLKQVDEVRGIWERLRKLLRRRPGSHTMDRKEVD